MEVYILDEWMQALAKKKPKNQKRKTKNPICQQEGPYFYLFNGRKSKQKSTV